MLLTKLQLSTKYNRRDEWEALQEEVKISKQTVTEAHARIEELMIEVNQQRYSVSSSAKEAESAKAEAARISLMMESLKTKIASALATAERRVGSSEASKALAVKS